MWLILEKTKLSNRYINVIKDMRDGVVTHVRTMRSGRFFFLSP